MELPPLPPRWDVPRLLDEVCAGNIAARQFCEVFVLWSHTLDDIIDADRPLPDPETFLRLAWETLAAFADNEFFQAHRAALLPLVVQGARAFEDSLAWAADPDVCKRQAADVLKGQYQEVLWHTAYLIGGAEHHAAITARWRHYQFDAN